MFFIQNLKHTCFPYTSRGYVWTILVCPITNRSIVLFFTIIYQKRIKIQEGFIVFSNQT